MAAELLDAFRKVRDIPEVAVVVLGGNGKAFCTGGDLSVFPSLAEHSESMNWLAHDGYGIGKAIELCEKSGYCQSYRPLSRRRSGIGSDVRLDLCQGIGQVRHHRNQHGYPARMCDVRIVRSMPIYRAREIIYSGRKDFLARDMYEMGFLTCVYKDDEFEAKFNEVVTNISSKKVIALRMAKEVMGILWNAAAWMLPWHWNAMPSSG